MSIAKELETTQDVTENVIVPPGDLYSDEPPLESELHLRQIILLLNCLEWLWRDRNDFYAAGNLTIYYSQNQRRNENFRGPDFFVVLGTDNHPRRSWILWAEEGKYPNLIVELLSNSTQKVDKTTKKQLYQDTFRTPEYFWFHPETLEFQGFRLMSSKYQAIEVTEEGWLWSEQLELFLGVRDGKLRYVTQDKQLVATPEERATVSQQQLEEERKQKQLAQQRVEELLAKLKDLGVEE